MVTDIVDSIRYSTTTVIWALNSRPGVTRESRTSIDKLKHLALQILQFSSNLRNERSLSINASPFHAAQTEADWFALFGSVLRGIPQLFIIVDLELFGGFGGDSGSWLVEFLRLFKRLSAGNANTKLKVVLARHSDDREEHQHAVVEPESSSAISSISRDTTSMSLLLCAQISNPSTTSKDTTTASTCGAAMNYAALAVIIGTTTAPKGTRPANCAVIASLSRDATGCR